jgi:hypothetical protein
MKPDLRLLVRVAPPDAHKTTWNIVVHGISDAAPCYYFRVGVENFGNAEARQVEVFASSLTRQRADGDFEVVG